MTSRLHHIQSLLRAAAIVFLLAAALCLSTTKGYCAETIKVGAILPITGEKAPFGQMEKWAFVLALEDINVRRKQAGEKTIELLVEDNASQPEGARQAIERLIGQGRVVLLTGGVSSNTVWAIAPIANKRAIPLLVTSASADKITEQEWSYVFRMCPPASEHYISLFSFLDKVVSPKSVAVFHENSFFGLKGAQATLASLKDKGYEITLNKGYKKGAEDFGPLLEEIREKAPDVIWLVSSAAEASLLIKQAYDLDLNPKVFVGRSGGFASYDFYTKAGPAAKNLITQARWSPSAPFEGAKTFAEIFQIRYNKMPDHHAAEAYAAALVIDDVLRRAPSTGSEDVRQALAETNLMTVLGPVAFTSYGKKTNQNRAPTYVVQWIGGRLEIVWPEPYATATFRPAR